MNVLKREMTKALAVITREKCAQWFNHNMSYVEHGGHFCVRAEHEI
jgi:hypothetical protein